MSGYKIKFNGIDRMYDAYSWRLTRRAKQAWKSGMVVGNKSHGHTLLLEKNISEYCKRKYAVAVGSGTDALFFALKVKNIGPGKRVICPAVSYMATAEAIKRTGATIDFVDVDNAGLIGSLDHKDKPDAVVYVNLFGNIANYTYLKKYCTSNNIPLIEDAAQSLGSSFKKQMSGNLGDVSALSFSPTKPLPAFGNAGMVLTDSEEEAQILQGYRYHGYNGVSIEYGFNSNISESVGSQLNFLFGKYKTFIKDRTKIYKQYIQHLENTPIECLDLNEHCISNHSKMVVLAPNRDELATFLYSSEIQTGLAYKMALPEMKMFASNMDNFPQAKKFCKNNLALPIYPFLKSKEVQYICQKVQKFYV